MKRNAILIAGIMFVAGASQAQEATSGQYESSRNLDSSHPAVTSTETVERDATSAVAAPDAGSYGESTSESARSEDYGDSQFEADAQYDSDHQDSTKADSSLRGESVEARGYDREANNDETEDAPDALNPGEKADSSIRGGSIYAREKEWNHDSEPSSGEKNRRMKADSSIRGGSVEARGGRELRGYGYNYQSPAQHNLNLNTETHDDFGQGSSAQWESDKASGSIRGSANWNPSDDLMRDGLGSGEAFEENNDASLDGAVRSDVREGSTTYDDLELEQSAVGSAAQSESGASSSSVDSDLNSSRNLEENISGEFDLEESNSNFESSTGIYLDTDHQDSASSSSYSSQTSTDIHHDESDLNAVESEMEMEAAGTAASSEVGTESSNSQESLEDSDEQFQSKDPALNTFQQPATSGDDLDFEYRDNRAHGVGSLATGEFGAAAAAQSGSATSGSDSWSNEDLARRIKARLTQESTGTHGLMRHQVARNIEVKANDGKVTLTGTVPSESDKKMIEVRVAEFAQVKKIDNQITVTPESDPANRDLGLGHDLEDRTSELQD